MNEIATKTQTTSKALNATRILISILNWNSLEDTEKCLEAIAPSATCAWNIVVIDNGSSENPVPRLAHRFPAIECIRLPANRGFTGGQNLGMQLAIDRGYEAVFLLNNDCQISPDAIGKLIAEMRADPLTAAVSPLIYCAENRTKPQVVAGWFDWANHCSIRPSTPTAPRPEGMPVALAGTALLLRCEALKEIGLLDERYFAYYEDNDLSARIAKAGWNARYCQSASAWHSSRPVAAYSDMALYLSARNAWLFWRTHTPDAFQRRVFIDVLGQSLDEIAHLKKAGATRKMAAVVSGFWDAQWNRFGKPPETLTSPALIRLLMCSAPYFLYRLLRDPTTTVWSVLTIHRS
jgi:GT2 family glycosyltransferase